MVRAGRRRVRRQREGERVLGRAQLVLWVGARLPRAVATEPGLGAVDVPVEHVAADEVLSVTRRQQVVHRVARERHVQQRARARRRQHAPRRRRRARLQRRPAHVATPAVLLWLDVARVQLVDAGRVQCHGRARLAVRVVLVRARAVPVHALHRRRHLQNHAHARQRRHRVYAARRKRPRRVDVDLAVARDDVRACVVELALRHRQVAHGLDRHRRAAVLGHGRCRAVELRLVVPGAQPLRRERVEAAALVVVGRRAPDVGRGAAVRHDLPAKDHAVELAARQAKDVLERGHAVAAAALQHGRVAAVRHADRRRTRCWGHLARARWLRLLQQRRALGLGRGGRTAERQQAAAQVHHRRRRLARHGRRRRLGRLGRRRRMRRRRGQTTAARRRHVALPQAHDMAGHAESVRPGQRDVDCEQRLCAAHAAA
eukprot:Unigene2035_Nuclearia_a/m.6330 Unigene2035_Nuclearia_a/g.6330  ORF Unigene2035_Nuclearia_a/g.6330 Unigene2035_Nuclearia_a/m.6330 type:complete len:429 (-) Unigene2035_Nuclearia_a:2141-3427(-)